jgi:peptidoglycan-associated lipoprotein
LIRPLSILALVALLPTLTGCAQQAQTTMAPRETPPSPQPAGPEQGPTAQSSSSSVAAARSPQSIEGFADEPALKDVFFEPDRADIVRDGATIMMANARWLLARWLFDNLDYLVLIEGHTDGRGTREEQLAIAELRATAAASFLRAMSVPDARLQTVSYGSDRPVCTEKSDACAAKNRRVHFRMKRK